MTPELRRRHGVYLTPQPLVGYLVRSVHRLLQTRLGRAAGLADSGVRLLDPAAGSMNFVRAAWRLALEAHWHRGGEAPELLREHLLPHFLGIELLPEIHARGLANLDRFLAMHGHVPESDEPLPALLGDALGALPELRDFPANVVLGNPPWGSGSRRPGGWIDGRLADYFRVRGGPLHERNPKWLNGEAVQFLRLAQWKIEQAGEGIAALVLPHNGLDASTFRGLRAALLDAFDEIYVLDLHGNRRKRERGPYGQPDENVFSGVAQGAAVFLLVRKAGLARRVLRADLYGTRKEKLAALAASHAGLTGWTEIQPAPSTFAFVGGDARTTPEYLCGLALPEIFPVHTTGVITGRDDLAVGLDRRALEERLRAICRGRGPRLDARLREQIQSDPEWQRRIVSFLARPFDYRFLLFADYFLERPRMTVMAHMEGGGNLALVASRQSRGEPGVLVTRAVAGHKAASTYDVSSLFPLYLQEGERRVPNLAPDLLARLAEHHGEPPAPEMVLGYVYAVLHDPCYRTRFHGLPQQDFSRIPFPRERHRFLTLAALGSELVDLHLLSDERLAQPPVLLLGDARKRLGAGPATLLDYREAERRLYVNALGLCFEGIAPEVLRYGVGGHPVLAGWLRARAGRVLLPGEVTAFRRIAAALDLTLDVQARIAAAGAGLEDAC